MTDTTIDPAVNPVTGRAERHRGHLREHRVNGPPGTGKTYYLSRQVERVIADPRYTLTDLLIVSLTKAAAREIAGRVDLPRRQVGTLHSHCYHALERPELAETPDGIRSWNAYVNDHGLLAGWRMDPRSAKDPDWTPPEGGADTTEGEQLLNQLSLMRARCASPDVYPPRISTFAQRWGAWKDSANRYDFTDLLERAIRELPRAPGDPAIIMVDEAQDLSTLELRLVRHWALQAEQIVVVGDQDQSIFQWRGADPQAMIEERPTSEITLERSRRVPARVHRYASGWIRRIPDRHDVTYLPRLTDPDDPASPVYEGQVETVAHGWAHPDGVVTRLRDDVAEGRSCMVLTTCAYMLQPLLSMLREHAVPFGNPYRPTQGAWNPLRGTGRLQAFVKPVEGHGQWTWNDVHAWMEPMHAAGTLVRGAKSQVEGYTVGGRFGEDPGERPARLSKLLPMFKREEDLERAVEGDAEWWLGTLREDRRKQARYGVRVYREHGWDALTCRPPVTVGTVHSVKGGEATNVYVFPDLSRRAYADGWLQPRTRPATIRLFYVAFTRARERLVLCAPSSGTYVRFPPHDQEETPDAARP